MKLTAANSFPIPYIGYIELNVDTMGLTILDCGFLIIKDPVSGGSHMEGAELKP